MALRSLASSAILVLVAACGGTVADPGPEASSSSLTVERGANVYSGYRCAADETTSFTGHGAIFVQTVCHAPTGDLALRLSLNDAEVGTWEGEEASLRAPSR